MNSFKDTCLKLKMGGQCCEQVNQGNSHDVSIRPIYCQEIASKKNMRPRWEQDTKIRNFVTETQESSDPIVLGYWNIRGLAQQIRFLLVYLDVDFFEQPYDEAEQWEWEQTKDSLGLKEPSLPYLIDERTAVRNKVGLTGPLAIMKYIAENFNPTLLGKSEED